MFLLSAYNLVSELTFIILWQKQSTLPMKGKSGLKSSKKVKYKFVSKLLNGDSLLPYREATQLNSLLANHRQ